MFYTYRVKRHGAILFRRGREIDALSHALSANITSSKPNTKHDHVQVCNDIERVHKQINSKQLATDPGTLEIDRLIQ